MIVLDLPKPLSVNRTRRIDWRAKPAIDRWVKSADALVNEPRAPAETHQRALRGDYHPTDRERDRWDNTPKHVIDYARRLELVDNDDPKRMRRLTIEFGEAPEGCRLTLREWQPET